MLVWRVLVLQEERGQDVDLDDAGGVESDRRVVEQRGTAGQVLCGDGGVWVAVVTEVSDDFGQRPPVPRFGEGRGRRRRGGGGDSDGVGSIVASSLGAVSGAEAEGHRGRAVVRACGESADDQRGQPDGDDGDAGGR